MFHKIENLDNRLGQKTGVTVQKIIQGQFP